ncbi:uncharacterized protein GJ701_006979 [Geothlypis trichas]
MYEQQVDWSAVIQSQPAMMRAPPAQLSPAGGIKGKWLAVSSVAFPALQPLWLSQLDHTELVKYFIISLLCTFSSSEKEPFHSITHLGGLQALLHLPRKDRQPLPAAHRWKQAASPPCWSFAIASSATDWEGRCSDSKLVSNPSSASLVSLNAQQVSQMEM